MITTRTAGHWASSAPQWLYSSRSHRRSNSRAKRYPLLAAVLSTVLALTACTGTDNGNGPEPVNTNTNTNNNNAGGGGGQLTNAQASSGSGPFTPREPQAAAVTTPFQFNANIFSRDGTKIVVTVFVPVIAKGAAIPLLVHSHGFGGSRVTNLGFEEANQTSEINQDVMQMVYNAKNPVAGRPGWYIISYDQRGHGESEGEVNIMDPLKEGEDYKAVLDWAEQNLPHLAYRQKDGKRDPVIGAIGRSYGGAYQLMGVGVDPRVDVILPGGTWYDLRYSLYPNSVAKTTYLNGLIASGAQSNRGRYPQFIAQGLAEANTSGNINATTINTLGSHGTVAYCDNGRTASADGLTVQRNVPAFFVQGLRDVLFNINEAITNFECFYRVNPAAKMLFARYGHSLDGLGLQEAPRVKDGKYSFNESRIWLKTSPSGCPAAQFESSTGRCIIPVKQLMLQFLTEHLYDLPTSINPTFLGQTPSPFPTITAVLDDATDNATAVEMPALSGINRPKVPGNTSLTAVSEPQQVVASALAPVGFGGTQLSALDQMGPVATFPIVMPENTPGKCLIGTPQVLIDVVTPSPGPTPPEPPVLYVGLNVRKTVGTTTTRRLLHEQVAPNKGYGSKLVTLPGISVKLGPGELLEVVVGGFNPIFVTSVNRVPTPVNVRVATSLPQPTVSGTACAGSGM